ncbi:MAG: hypothetical protein IJ563_00330 [Selenomonadaceae bacterium]|nr:hypothetical protein [Selenomonadaceae bacterium]
MSKLTLDKAKEILNKYTTEQHLLIHAAAVSAAMGAMANYFHADKDHWQAIGYLHDVDYEKYPDEHCHHVRELLEPEGVDEDDIKSIISHGYGVTTDECEPTTDLEKSLFAVDELTGIVHAYALMRPENMDGMSVKSLKKKYKDKRFAAGCSRDIINLGVGKLDLDLGVVMQCCIDGMTEHKSELGF